MRIFFTLLLIFKKFFLFPSNFHWFKFLFPSNFTFFLPQIIFYLPLFHLYFKSNFYSPKLLFIFYKLLLSHFSQIIFYFFQIAFYLPQIIFHLSLLLSPDKYRQITFCLLVDVTITSNLGEVGGTTGGPTSVQVSTNVGTNPGRQTGRGDNQTFVFDKNSSEKGSTMPPGRLFEGQDDGLKLDDATFGKSSEAGQD